MKLPNIDIMPFPNSVFYLTGISLITLVYATYSKTINKLPKAVSDGITTASSKINEVGKSISAGSKDLYGKMTSPSGGPGPVPPAFIAEKKALIPNPPNNVPTNPFAVPEPPTPLRPLPPLPPPRVGGSKKKGSKRNKKTKRSRR
jgi:hypothetical protein